MNTIYRTCSQRLNYAWSLNACQSFMKQYWLKLVGGRVE